MNSINISIPNIKNKDLFEKIIDLSGEKLIKVIELGIIAYDSTENQKQRWDNSDFNKKIKEIELSQIKKEKEFLNQLDSKNRIIKDIQREFSEKQSNLYKQIEQSVALNYQSQLNFKNETIQKISSELKEAQNNINILNNGHNDMERSRRNELIKEHKNEIQQLRNSYDKKIELLQESIMSIHKINDNSSIKGQIGENKMKQTLTMLFPKNEIEDTHSIPGRGDFIISCKNDKKILIDNKDYNTNVPKKKSINLKKIFAIMPTFSAEFSYPTLPVFAKKMTSN